MSQNPQVSSDEHDKYPTVSDDVGVEDGVETIEDIAGFDDQATEVVHKQEHIALPELNITDPNGL